ncbi:MAG: hypothetical protein HHJ11_06225 [Phycicoccus sp.]|nr:hypothetical protein [Phycicoccus sp.]
MTSTTTSRTITATTTSGRVTQVAGLGALLGAVLSDAVVDHVWVGPRQCV